MIAAQPEIVLDPYTWGDLLRCQALDMPPLAEPWRAAAVAAATLIACTPIIRTWWLHRRYLADHAALQAQLRSAR